LLIYDVTLSLCIKTISESIIDSWFVYVLMGGEYTLISAR
jgi:hypothetical protein